MKDMKTAKKIKSYSKFESAKNCIERVRSQGIQKSTSLELGMCLIGLGQKIDLAGILDGDLCAIACIRDACVQEDIFYEYVRRELFARSCDIRAIEYSSLTWTQTEQEKMREKFFTEWQKSKDNVHAMLYALACMPLPCWHFRLFLLLVQNGIIISPTPRLYDYALRIAGKKGKLSEACCEHGLKYMVEENEKQMPAREKESEVLRLSQDEDAVWGIEDEELSDEMLEWSVLFNDSFRWEK